MKSPIFRGLSPARFGNRQSASGAECGRLAREALKCRDASIAGLADFHSTQDHACRIALKCMSDETGVKPAPPLKHVAPDF
ncbi:hypothetical protein [Ralstonia solanacearum]|uniref:hypothetical protein n=1 Tax=Ralstonia solanacearum TaxID=305 RepID=UPI00168A4A3F|nr:hypothetical protein [Ralstonia solanacearum]QNT25852.1 hypothetical protein C2I38_027675 [Ralstonia solanacearum]QNT63465.1 hypothetical protein C2L97_27610 [Ralstonia solanacearum]